MDYKKENSEIVNKNENTFPYKNVKETKLLYRFMAKLDLYKLYTFNVVKINKMLTFSCRVENLLTNCYKNIVDLLFKVDLKNKVFDVKFNQIYCYICDDKRFRVVVLKVIDMSVCKIYLIDEAIKIYCNVSDLYNIYDEQLINKEALGVFCCFEKPLDFIKYFGHNTSISRSETNIYNFIVVSFVDGIYIVHPEFYNKTKHCLEIGEIYNLYIKSAESYDRIYAKSTDFIAKSFYNTLILNYNEFNPIQNSSDSFSIGEIVLCRSSSNLKWRRSKIINIISCGFEVTSLDNCGNSIVTLEHICKIPNIDKYFPPLYIRCSLPEYLDEREKYMFLNYAREHHLGFKCKLKIIHVDENDIHIIQVLEMISMISAPKYDDSVNPIKLSKNSYIYGEIPIGADLKISISHFISTTLFYVHIIREDFQYKLDKLMNHLSKFRVNKYHSNMKNFQTDQPVLVFNKESNCYYRGLILNILSNQLFIIQYVDFGIYEKIHISNIIPINQNLLREPILTFKCSLDDESLIKYPLISTQLQDINQIFYVLFTSIDPSGTYTIRILK